MKFNIKLLIFLFLFQHYNLFSQSEIDTRKYIAVTGSAEKTITPDEITLEITLTEYTKDNIVVKMESIENEFYAILKNNNVDTQGLVLNELQSSYWKYWWNNRNKTLKIKSFKISITNTVNFLKLTLDLNKKWVESINIAERKNKQIMEYRKEVKIAAIKAAKEKAKYLLESIGEHLGCVISVEEIPEEASYWRSRGNMLSNSISEASDNADEVNNVSGIKIRYEIKVKFEIQ